MRIEGFQNTIESCQFIANVTVNRWLPHRVAQRALVFVNNNDHASAVSPMKNLYQSRKPVRHGGSFEPNSIRSGTSFHAPVQVRVQVYHRRDRPTTGTKVVR